MKFGGNSVPGENGAGGGGRSLGSWEGEFVSSGELGITS